MEEKKERLKATDSPVWRSKKGDIKIEDMDKNYLQNILNFALDREFFFFTRAGIFTQKIDEILEVAEKKGIVLEIKESNEFFKNKKKHLTKK